MRPMISVAATTGLLEAITAAGGNPDHVLRTIGLDRSAFSNPEGFVASSSFAQLLEEAARATADDCFGLHFGERYNPKNIGPLVYVVLNSSTIGAGIANVERYLHVFNQAAKWFFTVEGNWSYIRFLLTDLGIEAPRQHNECSMAVALNTLRIMVGSQWAHIRFQNIAGFLAPPFRSVVKPMLLLSSVSLLSESYRLQTHGFIGF